MRMGRSMVTSSRMLNARECGVYEYVEKYTTKGRYKEGEKGEGKKEGKGKERKKEKKEKRGRGDRKSKRKFKVQWGSCRLQ